MLLAKYDFDNLWFIVSQSGTNTSINNVSLQVSCIIHGIGYSVTIPQTDVKLVETLPKAVKIF